MQVPKLGNQFVAKNLQPWAEIFRIGCRRICNKDFLFGELKGGCGATGKGERIMFSFLTYFVSLSHKVSLKHQDEFPELFLNRF